MLENTLNFVSVGVVKSFAIIIIGHNGEYEFFSLGPLGKNILAGSTYVSTYAES
jgi:hypothetical protein